MINEKWNTFILGAGSDILYNFPSGFSLFDRIKDRVYGYASSSYSDPLVLKEAQDFETALKSLGGVSIDKYLNINEQYMEIGKKAIINAIWQYEAESILPIDRIIEGDDWYSHIFNMMIGGLDTPEEMLLFGENRIRFITFNYDRSLEHFLFSKYKNLLINSKVGEDRIISSFRKIKFIHVYGQVGYLPWQEMAESSPELVWEYGKIVPSAFRDADQILSLINVMYSTRKDDVAIKEAIGLIDSSESIIFLGFGFDKKNLEILGFPNYERMARIIGTAKNKIPAEITAIRKSMSGSIDPTYQCLFDLNCTMLLRKYLH